MLQGVLHSQSLCGGSPRLENFCSDACVVCELDGLSLTTTHSIVGTVPPGYCTFIAHSMQWVGFVAGSVNLGFTVTVTNCTLGNSIELGVYETTDCNSFNLVSNCNTAMPVGSYSFANTTPLKPGCYYFIVIDGNGPASCSFNVSVTSGSATAPEPVISGPITGDDVVCEGETVTYSIPEVFGACEYDWVVTTGTVLGPTDGNEITVLWDQAPSGQVCVTARNICHSSDQVCKPVRIIPRSEPTFIGPFEVCAGNAYPYQGRFYPAGIWNIDFKNQYGCDTTVILEVIEIPVETFTIVEQICYPDCFTLGNRTLCDGGQYTEILRSQRAPFCDSIVILDLERLHVDAVVQKDGDLSCGDTLVLLTSDSSFVDGPGTFKRIWTNTEGDSLGDASTLEVCEAGYYILTLSLTTDRGTCSDSDTVFVGGSPEGPVLVAPDTIFLCRGDSLILSRIPIRDGNGASVIPTFFEDLPSTPSAPINDDTLVIIQNRNIGVEINVGDCTDEGIIFIQLVPNPLFTLPDTLELCKGEALFTRNLPLEFTGPDTGVVKWFVRDSTGMLDSFTRDGIAPDSSFWLLAETGRPYCISFDSILISIRESIIFSIQSPDSVCLGQEINISYVGPDLTGIIFHWDQNGQMISGGQNLNIIPDMAGSWEFSLWIEVDGCVSDTVSSFVFVSEPPMKPELNCEVIDTSLYIRWLNDPWASRIEAIPGPGSPPGQQINDTTWFFPDVPSGTSVSFRVTTLGRGGCGSETDSITCLVVFCPPIQISIDSIPPVCLPQADTLITLGLIGTAPGGFELEWSGTGIVDARTGIFDPILAGPGIHRVTASLSDNFCQYSASVLIEVLDPGPVLFTMPDSICSGDTVTLVADPADPGFSIEWDLGGAILIDMPATNIVEIRWNDPGQYTVGVRQFGPDCSGEFSYRSIEVIAPLPLLVPQCDADHTSITLSWNQLPGVTSYLVTTQPGNMSQRVTGNSFLVNGLNAGDSIRFTITPEWDGPCPVEPVEITCFSLPCPSVSLSLNPIAPFCLGTDNDAVPLNVTIQNAPPGGLVRYEGTGTTMGGTFDPVLAGTGSHFVSVFFEIYGCVFTDQVEIQVYEDPDVSIQGDEQLTCISPQSKLSGMTDDMSAGSYQWQTPVGTYITDTISASVPGWYHLVFTDSLSGCTSRDSILILNAMDGPQEIDFSTEEAGCFPANSGTLTIESVTGGTEPFRFFLDGNEVSGNLEISNLAAGDHLLQVEDVNGCVMDTLLRIDQVEPLGLVLEKDTTIEQGKSVQLISNVSRDVVSYSWSPAVPCGQCPDPIVRPQTDTRYFLRVTDRFGCIAESDVLIRVFKKSVFIPNAFTPNDDGINDLFNISGNEFVDHIESMQIFDRWGSLIYSSSGLDWRDPQAGWDGSSNGRELNPGVFVYCVRIRYTDGSTSNHCGDVTLIR